MDKLQGYRRMLRIGDWVKFYPLFPLAGAFIAAGLSSDLVGVFALFSCVTAYGFVVNNLYDAEIDRRHPGKTKQGKNPCRRIDTEERGRRHVRGHSQECRFLPPSPCRARGSSLSFSA